MTILLTMDNIVISVGPPTVVGGGHGVCDSRPGVPPDHGGKRRREVNGAGCGDA
jgi:hypothetical protein